MAVLKIQKVKFHERVALNGQYSLERCDADDGYVIGYDTELQHYSINHVGDGQRKEVSLIVPRERVNFATPMTKQADTKK